MKLNNYEETADGIFNEYDIITFSSGIRDMFYTLPELETLTVKIIYKANTAQEYIHLGKFMFIARFFDKNKNDYISGDLKFGSGSIAEMTKYIISIERRNNET